MIQTDDPHRAARQQRGITLFGLLFWAILIGFIGYVAVRVLPTVNEYLTIQRAVNKIAGRGAADRGRDRARPSSKQKDIEYSITSISGKDLEITKENDKRRDPLRLRQGDPARRARCTC